MIFFFILIKEWFVYLSMKRNYVREYNANIYGIYCIFFIFIINKILIVRKIRKNNNEGINKFENNLYKC